MNHDSSAISLSIPKVFSLGIPRSPWKGFNTKLVIHDLDDLGYTIRTPRWENPRWDVDEFPACQQRAAHGTRRCSVAFDLKPHGQCALQREHASLSAATVSGPRNMDFSKQNGEKLPWNVEFNQPYWSKIVAKGYINKWFHQYTLSNLWIAANKMVVWSSNNIYSHIIANCCADYYIYVIENGFINNPVKIETTKFETGTNTLGISTTEDAPVLNKLRKINIFNR